MRQALMMAALLVIVLVAVAIAIPADPPVVQPIAYNHSLHVEQEGMVCIDCHVLAEEHTVATIPRLSICMDCHDVDPMTESSEEEKLAGYIESETEVPWGRVYEVPDHVYFSHRRHVVLGELECATCHGPVAEQETPIVMLHQELSMNWCMDCHRTRGTTNDCITCHR